jgi:nicotinate-nucleotide adenylyltransferase
MNRIGILGGTFDPIHLGHLVPAEYAFNHLRLDRLILVPSAAPVHRPRHRPAPDGHRLAMCRLAAAGIPGFEASDIEVSRSEPSYTIYTLQHFARTQGPGAELYLLVGEDNLPLLHTWKDIAEIVRLARLAIMPRPPAGPVDLSGIEAALGRDRAQEILAGRIPAPLVPISATDIRNRVRLGQPITGLVPSCVERYIFEHGLYV